MEQELYPVHGLGKSTNLASTWFVNASSNKLNYCGCEFGFKDTGLLLSSKDNLENHKERCMNDHYLICWHEDTSADHLTKVSI